MKIVVSCTLRSSAMHTDWDHEGLQMPYETIKPDLCGNEPERLEARENEKGKLPHMGDNDVPLFTAPALLLFSGEACNAGNGLLPLIGPDRPHVRKQLVSTSVTLVHSVRRLGPRAAGRLSPAAFARVTAAEAR